MITKTQLDQIIKREAENVSVQNHPKDCARFVEHGANILAPALLEAIEALNYVKSGCKTKFPGCTCVRDTSIFALERIEKMLGEK